MRNPSRLLILFLLWFTFVTTLTGGCAAQTRLVVQTGHSNNVSSVAFSPDGKTLASGSWDNTIKLWEVATGHELRALTGHSSYVTSGPFTPDGHTFATEREDKPVGSMNVVGRDEHRAPAG